MKHELKIWPQYFCRVKDGTKTFEVRENDRGFQPGDEVVLREFDPNIEWYKPHDYCDSILTPVKGRYSGENLSFKVGYVFPIDDKRVVFSLLPPDNTANPLEEI